MLRCSRCQRALVPNAAGHGWYGGRLACSQQCGAELQRVRAGPFDSDDDISYDSPMSTPADYGIDDDDVAQMEREQRQIALLQMKSGALMRTRDASFDYVAQLMSADADGMVTARALLRRRTGGYEWTPLWDEQFLQVLSGDDYGVQSVRFAPGMVLADDSDELAALRAAYPAGAAATYHNLRTDRTNACRVLAPPAADGMLLVGHLATADALSLAYAQPAEERVPAAAVAPGDGAAVNTLLVQTVRERGMVVQIASTQPELTSAYEQVVTERGLVIRQRDTAAPGGVARELATREMAARDVARQVGFAPETDRIHLWGWWDAEADTLRLVHFHVPANSDEIALTVHTIDTAPGAREPDDYWFTQRAAKARTRDGGFIVLVWARRVHRVFYAPAATSTVHMAMFEYTTVPARHTLVRVGDWVGRVQALPLGLDARTELLTPDEPCAGGRAVETCPRIGIKSSADLAGRVRIEWLGTMSADTVHVGLRENKEPIECVTACGVVPLPTAEPEHALFVRALDKDRAARVDGMLDQVAKIIDRLRRAPLPLSPEQTTESSQAETLLARVFDSELIAFYTQPDDLVRRTDELRLRLASVLRAARFGAGGNKRAADSEESGAKRTLAAQIGRWRVK